MRIPQERLRLVESLNVRRRRSREHRCEQCHQLVHAAGDKFSDLHRSSMTAPRCSDRRVTGANGARPYRRSYSRPVSRQQRHTATQAAHPIFAAPMARRRRSAVALRAGVSWLPPAQLRPEVWCSWDCRQGAVCPGSGGRAVVVVVQIRVAVQSQVSYGTTLVPSGNRECTMCRRSASRRSRSSS